MNPLNMNPFEQAFWLVIFFGHMGTRLLRNDSHRSIRQNNRVVRLTKTVQSNFRATRNITTSFSIGLGARCEVRSIVPTEREKIKF